MKDEGGVPEGWREKRVRDVLAHYEGQTEDEALAEDEGTLTAPVQATMSVPVELVPLVRELIAEHERRDVVVRKGPAQVGGV